MKPTASLRRGLAKVRRESKAERYDAALGEVERLLTQWPDNPRLLVLQAELVQLKPSPNSTKSAAKTLLKRAVELDEREVHAHVELGHYEMTAEGKPAVALKTFLHAESVARRLLEEALLGKAAALTELGRRYEAFEALADANHVRLRPPAKSVPHIGILSRLESLSLSAD